MMFLASEIRAIRVSTQTIEHDTREIKATVEGIEQKINILNSRMDEAEARVATLEDTMDASKQHLDEVQTEIQKLRDHIDDLDNRGRCCNIKILGILEEAEGDDMVQFLQREIPGTLERTFTTQLEIQRAHRVPTGRRRGERGTRERPRPVMVNMLRYQVKEEILRATREKRQIVWWGAKIMFFTDYSRQVMERFSFKQVKTDLKNRGVEYVLRFPAVLEFKHNGARCRFSSPEEASDFIKRKITKEN